MLACWDDRPESRPTFTDILHTLTTILNGPDDSGPLSGTEHNYINLYMSVDAPESSAQKDCTGN